MDHPPYSPNLVLSDFCLDLCLVLKEGLQGTKFNSDAEVVPALEEFFCDQVADFFLNCVNIGGITVFKCRVTILKNNNICLEQISQILYIPRTSRQT